MWSTLSLMETVRDHVTSLFTVTRGDGTDRVRNEINGRRECSNQVVEVLPFNAHGRQCHD